MKEFINFPLAGSTVTNSISLNATYWAFDIFFPQRMAGIVYIIVNWGAMQIWPKTITYLQFSKSSQLKRDSIDYVFFCLLAFVLWNTAPPGHAYAKVATFLQVSLCGSSLFLGHFSPKSPWATPLGKLSAPQGKDTKLFKLYRNHWEWAVIETLKGGQVQPLKGLEVKISFDHRRSKPSLLLYTQSFHWKNLCCLFIIAKSIILGTLKKRAELQRTWLRISIEVFCLYKPINFTDKQWIANHFLFTCGTYVGINELYSISIVIMSNIFIYNNWYLGCNLIFVVQENGYKIFEGFYYGFPWGCIQHLY